MMNLSRSVNFLIILLFSSNVWAVQIAVIEVQKIFEQSNEAKELKRSLEKEFFPRQKVLEGKQAELKIKIQVYEKNRSVLGEEEIKQKEREIIKLRQEYQLYGRTLQTDLQKKQQDNVRQIEAIIEQIIEKIAKKKNLDLVLFQGIAFHKPSLNITKDVIKVMNAKK